MAGAVLLLAGAVLQITRWELAPYLYTLGAVMFGYVQVMDCLSFHCRCPGTLYGFPYSAGVGEGKTLRNQCHFLSAFIEAYLVKNRRTRTTLVTCGPRSKK